MKIKLRRHRKDEDSGYFIPELFFEKVEVLLDYGIVEDISFEQSFSDM